MRKAAPFRVGGRPSAVVLCCLLAGLLGACDAGASSEQRELADDCVAPKDAVQRDVDRRDSREVPFHRRSGHEVQVEIMNANLRPALWRQVEEAASIWAASPCLDPVVVERCAEHTHCITFRAHPAKALRRLEPGGGWGDSDGVFTGRQRNDHRVGGRVSLNLDFFDSMSPNGRLATIVHELGHAFGLRHRKDRNDVLHSVTGDRTNPQPDKTDLYNLRVLYGGNASP